MISVQTITVPAPVPADVSLTPPERNGTGQDEAFLTTFEGQEVGVSESLTLPEMPGDALPQALPFWPLPLRVEALPGSSDALAGGGLAGFVESEAVRTTAESGAPGAVLDNAEPAGVALRGSWVPQTSVEGPADNAVTVAVLATLRDDALPPTPGDQTPTVPTVTSDRMAPHSAVTLGRRAPANPDISSRHDGLTAANTDEMVGSATHMVAPESSGPLQPAVTDSDIDPLIQGRSPLSVHTPPALSTPGMSNVHARPDLPTELDATLSVAPAVETPVERRTEDPRRPAPDAKVVPIPASLPFGQSSTAALPTVAPLPAMPLGGQIPDPPGKTEDIPVADSPIAEGGFWQRFFSGLEVPKVPESSMQTLAALALSVRSGDSELASIKLDPGIVQSDAAGQVPDASLPKQPTSPQPAATVPPRFVTAFTGSLAAISMEALADDPLLPLFGPVAAGGPTPTFQTAAMFTPAPAMPQIVAQITSALATPGEGVTELLLSPDELGHVRLRLEPDAANPDRMVVMISFERPETLDLFRRHAGELAEAIRAAGYSGADIGFGQSGTGHGDEPSPDRASSARTEDARDFGSDAPPPSQHNGRAGPSSSLDLRL